MTMTDPIADMLTRIRNANSAQHDTVRMPGSKLKVSLANILQREGFIADYKVEPNSGKPGTTLEITMKYSGDRTRTIDGRRTTGRLDLDRIRATVRWHNQWNSGLASTLEECCCNLLPRTQRSQNRCGRGRRHCRRQRPQCRQVPWLDLHSR